jgi:hypothetical protein
MKRKAFLIGAGVLAGVCVFGAKWKKPEEILEVTVSWEDDTNFNASFMGQEFNNGDVKRFKLLEEYEQIRGENEAWIKKFHSDSSYYESCTPNWCMPVGHPKEDCIYSSLESTVNSDPTFHMFLDGRKSGSFSDNAGVTVKWDTVKDDGTPYHEERIIKNKYHWSHT